MRIYKIVGIVLSAMLLLASCTNSEEERVKSDYEKLVEGSSVKKGMFAVYQKKNDYYFEVPTSLLGRDLLVVNKLQRVPAELNDAGVNRGVNYENQMICMEWDKVITFTELKDDDNKVKEGLLIMKNEIC